MTGEFLRMSLITLAPTALALGVGGYGVAPLLRSGALPGRVLCSGWRSRSGLLIGGRGCGGRPLLL